MLRILILHNNKWKLRQTGPHLVTQRMSYVNYVIRFTPTGKSKTTHVDRLTRYTGPISAEWSVAIRRACKSEAKKPRRNYPPKVFTPAPPDENAAGNHDETDDDFQRPPARRAKITARREKIAAGRKKIAQQTNDRATNSQKAEVTQAQDETAAQHEEPVILMQHDAGMSSSDFQSDAQAVDLTHQNSQSPADANVEQDNLSDGSVTQEPRMQRERQAPSYLADYQTNKAPDTQVRKQSKIKRERRKIREAQREKELEKVNEVITSVAPVKTKNKKPKPIIGGPSHSKIGQAQKTVNKTATTSGEVNIARPEAENEVREPMVHSELWSTSKQPDALINDGDKAIAVEARKGYELITMERQKPSKLTKAKEIANAEPYDPFDWLGKNKSTDSEPETDIQLRRIHKYNDGQCNPKPLKKRPWMTLSQQCANMIRLHNELQLTNVNKSWQNGNAYSTHFKLRMLATSIALPEIVEENDNIGRYSMRAFNASNTVAVQTENAYFSDTEINTDTDTRELFSFLDAKRIQGSNNEPERDMALAQYNALKASNLQISSQLVTVDSANNRKGPGVYSTAESSGIRSDSVRLGIMSKSDHIDVHLVDPENLINGQIPLPEFNIDGIGSITHIYTAKATQELSTDGHNSLLDFFLSKIRCGKYSSTLNCCLLKALICQHCHPQSSNSITAQDAILTQSPRVQRASGPLESKSAEHAQIELQAAVSQAAEVTTAIPRVEIDRPTPSAVDSVYCSTASTILAAVTEAAYLAHGLKLCRDNTKLEIRSSSNVNSGTDFIQFRNCNCESCSLIKPVTWLNYKLDSKTFNDVVLFFSEWLDLFNKFDFETLNDYIEHESCCTLFDDDLVDRTGIINGDLFVTATVAANNAQHRIVRWKLNFDDTDSILSIRYFDSPCVSATETTTTQVKSTIHPNPEFCNNIPVCSPDIVTDAMDEFRLGYLPNFQLGPVYPTDSEISESFSDCTQCSTGNESNTDEGEINVNNLIVTAERHNLCSDSSIVKVVNVTDNCTGGQLILPEARIQTKRCWHAHVNTESCPGCWHDKDFSNNLSTNNSITDSDSEQNNFDLDKHNSFCCVCDKSDCKGCCIDENCSVIETDNSRVQLNVNADIFIPLNNIDHSVNETVNVNIITGNSLLDVSLPDNNVSQAQVLFEPEDSLELIRPEYKWTAEESQCSDGFSMVTTDNECYALKTIGIMSVVLPAVPIRQQPYIPIWERVFTQDERCFYFGNDYHFMPQSPWKHFYYDEQGRTIGLPCDRLNEKCQYAHTLSGPTPLNCSQWDRALRLFPGDDHQTRALREEWFVWHMAELNNHLLGPGKTENQYELRLRPVRLDVPVELCHIEYEDNDVPSYVWDIMSDDLVNDIYVDAFSSNMAEAAKDPPAKKPIESFRIAPWKKYELTATAPHGIPYADLKAPVFIFNEDTQQCKQALFNLRQKTGVFNCPFDDCEEATRLWTNINNYACHIRDHKLMVNTETDQFEIINAAQAQQHKILQSWRKLSTKKKAELAEQRGISDFHSFYEHEVMKPKVEPQVAKPKAEKLKILQPKAKQQESQRSRETEPRVSQTGEKDFVFLHRALVKLVVQEAEALLLKLRFELTNMASR